MREWLSKHKSLVSIMLLVVSIILLGGNLTFKIFNIVNEVNPTITMIGCLCTTIGIMMTLYEHDRNE